MKAFLLAVVAAVLVAGAAWGLLSTQQTASWRAQTRDESVRVGDPGENLVEPYRAGHESGG